MADSCDCHLPAQTLHSLSKNRLELINSIAPYVEERVLPVLKPVSKCWQPYDMLPKPEDPDFVDQVTWICYGYAYLITYSVALRLWCCETDAVTLASSLAPWRL